MKEILVIMSLMGLLVFSGFYSGRLFERKDWQKRIPESMSLLCMECKQIGEDQVLSRVDK